jgi:hypothetical protein
MQSSAPDDGEKHRPKHVDLIRNNTLIYIMHIVGYFLKLQILHQYNTQVVSRTAKIEALYVYLIFLTYLLTYLLHGAESFLKS